MTKSRRSQKIVHRSRTAAMLIGASACAQLLLSSAALAAPSQEDLQPAAATRDAEQVANRPNCGTALRQAGESRATRTERRRDRVRSKPFCRLALAVELSIRDNPGIF